MTRWPPRWCEVPVGSRFIRDHEVGDHYGPVLCERPATKLDPDGVPYCGNHGLVAGQRIPEFDPKEFTT